MRTCFANRLAAMVLVVLGAGACGAVEYFPSEPGPVFVYGGGELEISTWSDGEFARIYCADCFAGSSESYLIDETGNVLQSSLGFFSVAGPDPDGHVFSPPLTYLDFPLETGKAWASTARQEGLWGGDEGVVTLSVSVAGEKQVTVPAGTFDVFELVLAYEYELEDWRNWTTTLWLHRQLGPVNGLVSWTGIVADAETSWGTIKSLYR